MHSQQWNLLKVIFALSMDTDFSLNIDVKLVLMDI